MPHARKVGMEQITLEERRFRAVVVDGRLIDSLIRPDPGLRWVQRVECDLPKDATLVMMQWEPAYAGLLLFYEHETFDVVLEGQAVPVYPATWTAHVYEVVDG